MTRLTDHSGEYLCAGAKLRFVGEYPFDAEPVDFMMCDHPAAGAGRCNFALYCVSGCHAGVSAVVTMVVKTALSGRFIKEKT